MKNIKKLSPDFVSTYNESAHAETLGLKSICGMGYRKALEFLVKDYVISNHPADSESISKYLNAMVTFIDSDLAFRDAQDLLCS